MFSRQPKEVHYVLSARQNCDVHENFFNFDFWNFIGVLRCWRGRAGLIEVSQWTLHRNAGEQRIPHRLRDQTTRYNNRSANIRRSNVARLFLSLLQPLTKLSRQSDDPASDNKRRAFFSAPNVLGKEAHLTTTCCRVANVYYFISARDSHLDGATYPTFLFVRTCFRFVLKIFDIYSFSSALSSLLKTLFSL